MILDFATYTRLQKIQSLSDIIFNDDYVIENPPKNEDKQYAYDIIQKAYEINEKKIEMLDFDKNKKQLKGYYSWLDIRRK